MSTIKINELATSNISLSDFFAKADANGLATKNTIQGLANILDTASSSQFRGSLAIADTPTLDGWYFATESGTYTNAGSLVVSVVNKLAIIIVQDTQTTFSKVEIDLIALETTFDANDTSKGAVMSAISSYVISEKQTGVIENSFAYNASYSSASDSGFNLTTSEELTKGVVKSIKLDVVTSGIGKFAFLRNVGTRQFKIIKYFEVNLSTGLNEINVNEFIDENFHFCLLKNSVSINTANGNVGDPLSLYFTASDIDETVTFTESVGRGHNIEISIDTNPLNFPTKTTGKTICYCGDSITDFMDSVASNGKNYIGYDVHINRYLNFNSKTILGFSGIRAGQSGGFADTKIASLPVSDIYTIYLGTNDFAIATQTTLGTITDYFNNTGINTYYGALRVIIDAMYNKNPLAKIILFTPSHRDYSGLNSWGDKNANGDTLNDFANAVREIGNYMSLDVVDLFAECNLNLTSDVNATYDNLHPNTLGYQLIAECFIQKMYNKL